MTPADLKQLEHALSAHLKASKDVYIYDRLLKDMAFHLTLAELSGCAVQHQTLKNLFDLLYLKYGGNYLFSTSMDSADTDHKELFARIREADAKGARQVLSGHIRRVKTHVVRGVERMLAATRF